MILRIPALPLLLLVATPSIASQDEGMMRFEGLSPKVAEILRDAREDTERQVGLMTNAASRSNAWGRLGMFYHAQHLPYAAELAYGRALVGGRGPAVALSKGNRPRRTWRIGSGHYRLSTCLGD